MGLSMSQDNQLVEDSLRRVRDGEIDQFEVVVRRFERPLRAWLATRSAPGIDVDEIAQQSFLTAYTRLADYRPGTDFGAWLFAIANYQLKTETTRTRRVADYRSRIAVDLLARELERQNAEPADQFVERLDHLQQCLQSLGEAMLRFIRWRYEDEISLEEMGERSDRSVASVKKQLWVLRNQLRKCVESRMAAAK